MKKLLIVDDERDVREFLQGFFEDRGYTVVTASTKEEALEALVKEKPLVALLDIRMKTQRDGLDILGWIKEQGMKTKTIMVTALGTRQVIEEALELGCDDYITKPLSLDYLEGAVTEKIRELTSGEPPADDK